MIGTPSAEQVCEWIHHGPADIQSNHLAAEVQHHVFDEHRDHSLVLNDENSAPWLVGHALLRREASKAMVNGHGCGWLPQLRKAFRALREPVNSPKRSAQEAG